MKDFRQSLREFLLGRYRIESKELANDSPLFSTGLLDSFAMVELVSFSEAMFEKKVRARDLTLENFDSIDRIARYFATNS